MNDQSQNTNKPELSSTSSGKKSLLELLQEDGIKAVDRTAEREGQTSIMFTNSPSRKLSDEAETEMH